MKRDEIIYFDNAATSFPKPKSVIKAVNNCFESYCGNPSRSSHTLSLRASAAVYETRCKTADFFGCRSEERVVFTMNATHAINLAIKSLITEPCHVIVSDIEHNSVIRPLEKHKKTIGISYSCFDSDKNVQDELVRLVRKNTKYVISTACSNVTGKKIDLERLSAVCKVLNLSLIVDASQAAGHTYINMNDLKLAALCAPSHKSLFGIQGGGFIIFGDIMPRDTILEGGSGSYSISKQMPYELPDMLEAGTPNVPACAALGAGIDFINSVGIENIEYTIGKMRKVLEERLHNIEGIKILGCEGSIISFNIGNFPSSKIAQELDKIGICTRSGLHCAPSVHKKLKTLSQGTVRISFSYFNSQKDIDAITDALYKISQNLKKI